MEPSKRDIVHGWWGIGRVTDVAEGQGNSRVKTTKGKVAWIMNSDIILNETKDQETL